MNQNTNSEALPIVSHVHDNIPPERDRTDTHTTGHQNILTQRGSRSDETLSGSQQTNTDYPPAGGGPHTGSASQRPQDFDDSANALWSLYEKEAKSHDEATVGTIKDDMDGVLIFAGLFSAVLTGFIIDRYQNIQQNPAQQSVYYQRQSTLLLNQISHQLSSLGAQFPSNLSLPEPTPSPSKSDIRVNIYWFISLVSSLSAALLATLVQRWARDHMHVFRRYGHPLKIARIRQFLHEGVERWHMLAIAEGAPGLIHISLFLFFMGLADFLWNTFAIAGIITVVLVVLIATLYIFSTVVSIKNPQSPYRTSFTGLAWYITRKIRTRMCKDRNGIEEEPLSSNMAKGQMQLAMEKNGERKGRDERAIRWLVNNLTEDIEMESLASGIPGSFDGGWGEEVWRNDPEMPNGSQSPDRHSALSNFRRYISNSFSLARVRNSRSSTNLPATPSAQTDPDPIPQTPSHLPVCREVVSELCKRIRRLFETCNHRGSFVNQDEWRRRSRACIETAASFVFCMDADISWFGDIGKLLNDLGSAERTHEVSASSLNRTFTTRWTCLSLVSIRNMLKSPQLQQCAEGTMQTLVTPGDGFTPLETARRIDEQFAAAWDCVQRLHQAFKALGEGNHSVERAEEVLSQHRPRLEGIKAEADGMKRVDEGISNLQKQIDRATHNLTRQLPGVAFDDLRTDHVGPAPINQVFDFLANPVKPQLSYLSQRLLGLCSLGQTRSSRGYLDTPEVLRGVENIPSSLRSTLRRHRLMERQLWRLEDLGRGGAFGFTLELYFLSLRQILSAFTSSPRDIDISFFIGAFEAITLDWEQVKKSCGTLQIILNLVCDIAIESRGIFSNYTYPGYITKKLLKLLGNVIEEQANPCIEAAWEELQNIEWRTGDKDFKRLVLKIFQDHHDRQGAPLPVDPS